MIMPMSVLLLLQQNVCVCVYREKWSAFVIPEKSENFGKITNSCKQELSQNLE